MRLFWTSKAELQGPPGRDVLRFGLRDLWIHDPGHSQCTPPVQPPTPANNVIYYINDIMKIGICDAYLSILL